MMDRSNYRPLSTCQSCGGPTLRPVVFLGYMPMVNTLPEIGKPAPPEEFYPLEVVGCDSCGLIQLSGSVRPELVFPQDYPFLSGLTPALRRSFADLVAFIQLMKPLGRGVRVIDVGSNDGTLLKMFQEQGCDVFGVEPTGTADLAIAQGVPTRKAFFSETEAQRLQEEVGSADVICVTNTLAHVENLHDFLRGVRRLLKPDGVLAVEVHSWASILEKCQFDKMTHEHQRYFSLKSLSAALGQHGLHPIFAEKMETHGGSMRVIFSPQSSHKPSNWDHLVAAESEQIDRPEAVPEFRRRIFEIKRDLQVLLATCARDGRRVVGLGAPSRAFLLMRLVGMDQDFIEALLELPNSPKVGRYVPGTRIPIQSEEELWRNPPDVLMVLAWHVAADITRKLRDRGFRGKFLIPLPNPRICDEL